MSYRGRLETPLFPLTDPPAPSFRVPSGASLKMHIIESFKQQQDAAVQCSRQLDKLIRLGRGLEAVKP
jgi:hypothetical protein